MWSDTALSDEQAVVTRQTKPEETSLASWELTGRGRGRIKPRRSNSAAQHVKRLTRLSQECVLYLQQQLMQAAWIRQLLKVLEASLGIFEAGLHGKNISSALHPPTG